MRGHSVIGWISMSLGIISIILSLLTGVEAFGFYLGIISLIFGIIVRFTVKDNFGVAGSALGLIGAYLAISTYTP